MDDIDSIPDVSDDEAGPAYPKPLRPGRTEPTDPIKKLTQKVDHLEMMITTLMGKIDALLEGQSEIRKKQMIFERGMPSLRTSGPTNHLMKSSRDQH